MLRSLYHYLSSTEGRNFITSLAAIGGIIELMRRFYREWVSGGREATIRNLVEWYRYLPTIFEFLPRVLRLVGNTLLVVLVVAFGAFMLVAFGIFTAVVGSAIVYGLGVWDVQSAGNFFFYVGLALPLVMVVIVGAMAEMTGQKKVEIRSEVTQKSVTE